MKLTPLYNEVLRFLREEVFSTTTIIQTLLCHKSPQASGQLLERMCRDGFLIAANISMVKGRALRIYGITEKGQIYAWQLEEKITTQRTFQPSKISSVMLQHELDMQILHIKAEREGWTNWVNGKSLGKRLFDEKCPDAIAVSPTGVKHCIEVERTFKSAARYRQIIASHLAMRKKNAWEKIIYLCPEQDFASRLERKIRSLEYLIFHSRRIQLTPEHLRHFIFTDYNFFKR